MLCLRVISVFACFICDLMCDAVCFFWCDVMCPGMCCFCLMWLRALFVIDGVALSGVCVFCFCGWLCLCVVFFV